MANPSKPTKFWLKLTGIAIAVHVVLIILSVAEVTLYSTAVRSGENQEFYQHHAELTGPYISAVFGFILFFLIVRKLVKNNMDRKYSVLFGLFVIYMVIDIIILMFFGVDWSSYWTVLLWANGAKLLGGYLALHRARTSNRPSLDVLSTKAK